MRNNRIAKLTGLIFCLLLLAGNALAQDERAQTVLKQARAALGGEAGIAALQSLTVSGTARHTLRGPQEQVLEEKFELSFLLPDKFLKTKTIMAPDGSGEMKITEGLNGNQEWMNVGSNGAAKSGDVMFFGNVRQAGTPGLKAEALTVSPPANLPFGAGVSTITVPAPGEGKFFERAAGGEIGFRTATEGGMPAGLPNENHGEFTRYLLAFLLTTPAASSVEWSYAGKADTDAGRADVLAVKAADGFAARLFLDEQTHLPLQLSYQPLFTQFMMAVAAPPPGVAATALPPNGAVFSGKLRKAQDKEPEVLVRFSDYREVGGLRFPHQLRFTTDGETDEEWVGLNWQPNANLTPEQFQPQKQ